MDAVETETCRVVRGMPIEEYHSHDSTSSSGLADFKENPLLWYYRKTCVIPRKKRTSAMEFGTSVHEAIEKGVQAVAVTVPSKFLNDQGHCKGKAFTDWKKDQPEGALILKEGEPNPYQMINDHLHMCESAQPFLSTPSAELSMFFQLCGLDCRVRIDAISESGVIGDWKTCRDISERGFIRDAQKMHYPLRLAMYREGVEIKTGVRMPVVTFAIENVEPYRVRPFEIDSEWLDRSRQEMLHLLPRMDKYLPEETINAPSLLMSEPKWNEFEFEKESEQEYA